MYRIKVGCQIDYTTSLVTPAVLIVKPPPQDGLTVSREQFELRGATAKGEYVDGFGNRCQRVTLAPGTNTIRYEAVVMVPEDQDRVRSDARQVPADSIPRHQRGPGAPSTSTAAPETPSIHVRIGRIEVRAAPQAAAPARPAAAKGSSGFAELRLARAHLDRTWR